MDKHSKIIITALLGLISFLSIIIIRQLNWQTESYLGFGLGAILLGLTWALVNFENFFLFILILLPAIYNFNSAKISLSLNQLFSNYLNIDVSINPISILYLLMIVFFIIEFFDFRKNFNSIPLNIVLSLSVFWAGLSLIWSDFKAISIIELIYFVIPFIFYFIAYNHFDSPKKFIKLYLAVIFSSLIPLIYSFWQLITGKLFYEADSTLGRLDSTMAHPNSYGLFLVTVIGITFSYYLGKKEREIKKNKTILIFLAAMLLSLLLTYSRTSWICLTIFAMIIAYREKVVGRLAVIAAPLFVMILSLSESVRLRLLDLFNQNIFNSLSARTSLWEIAWQKIIDHPLLGYGVGTAEPVIELAKTWQGGASLPHNDFILQMLELGLFGLFAYCLYTFGALTLFIKSTKTIKNHFTELEIYSKKSTLNLHVLAIGLSTTYLSLLPATVFESVSQKILIQIAIWSLLGGLIANQKRPAD